MFERRTREPRPSFTGIAGFALVWAAVSVRLRRLVVPTLLVSTWLVGEGCLQHMEPIVAEPGPTSLVPANATVKVVPAETPFAVQLETELNSLTNRPGERFRARVMTPVAGQDGDTVVPADAELVGRVVAVSGAPESAILVRFDAIETLWGSSAVRATFTRAQPEASVFGDRARFAGYDGALQSAGGIPLFGDATPSEATAATAVPIELPPGARLQIVLTEPMSVRALMPPTVAAPPGQ